MSDGQVVSHNKIGLIIDGRYVTFWVKTHDVNRLLSKVKDNSRSESYIYKDLRPFEFTDSEGYPVLIALDKVSFMTILE